MVYTPKTSPYNPWMTMVVVASTTAALAQWHTYVHLSLCVWILYSTFMGHWPLPKTRINWMQAASSLNLKYLVKGVSPGKKRHTHTIEWNWKSTSFWRQPNMLRELTLQDLYEKYLVMIRVMILCCTIVCYEPETLKASHIRKIYIFSQTKTRDTCHIKKNSYHDI